MKKTKLLSLLLVLVMVVSLLPASVLAADDAYDPIFDLKENYMGEYTATVGGKTYVYDAWQAKYCDTPYVDTWENAEDFFKLNVKVVKSIDGKPVQLDTASAPILFYNPWGGDNGAAVRDPGSTASVALTWEAMEQGYVIVEPGMRGNNCYTGTIGEDDYYDYGKLPGPLADLKAAIRYLRYESNAETIPGNKERIWVAGTSSGGDATVILGSSGNSPYFDEALAEINALPGRDDVFGVFPSCPVQTRHWADVALAWERWGDLSDVEGAHEVNKWLSSYFADYEKSLGLTATFATENIKVGDALTADNYAEYLMTYVKDSAIKYLNTLGGKDAIDAYLATDLPASMMYGTTAASRSWIKPVYDDAGTVIDIDGTWDEFWAYVVGADYYDYANEINYQYDKVMVAPDDCMTANGMGNANVGTGLFAKWANASSFSFGKGDDFVGVFTQPGQDWIREKRGIAISDEYLALVEKQRNCTDPLYFILGDGTADSTTCANWYIRTGSIDLVTPHPIIVNLATALENKGNNVGFAFVWEQGHGLSNDRAPFFTFAAKAMAEADGTSEFLFDAEKAYCGEYTAEYNGNTFVFKTYQVKYCDAPFTDEWENAENYFKMNIKVPVSYNGVPFKEADLAKAPIMFANPWGGDNGAAVDDPANLAAKRRDALIAPAMAHGWIIVEPGMRGNNCYSGTIGGDDYVDYGKLPGPIADLKAAIRYLRYSSNAETIPGDKERIWISGTSSGGDATVMIASSGNSHFFDEALAEIGALPGRDDVFGAMPSCPVMDRGWGDPALCWERWGTLEGNAEANETNAYFAKAFPAYIESLGLKASFATENIQVGDALTGDNYAEYVYAYIKDSAVKFLNGLGGKDAVEAYLAENKPAVGMYFSPETSRAWVKPVFDANGVVTDIEGTWEEFWNYVVGDEMFDPAKLCDLQYERAVNATDEMFDGNGIVNEKAGDRSSPYFNASTPSFGKRSDYGAVFSEVGQKYLQEIRGIEISQEYLDLIEMQRNSTDPLYFILGEGAADATVSQHWYMRAGTIDLVIPSPILVALGTALENQGADVDTALVWEQGHGLTSDIAPFWTFAEEAMNGAEAVVASSQSITVDGEKADVEAFNIDGYNYVKLRDMAALLNGTARQFSVAYDEATKFITAVSGEGYDEGITKVASGDIKCVATLQTLNVNGEICKPQAYNINGYNYFRLRDLAACFGFGIDYDEAAATAVVTTK